ncbi:ribokinase [Gemmobacter aquatilis]|uniref:Ribokinase n=1 Tax=Gemmobacter aquatilis TaxID=933059 RepID=A0A1H7YX20_9RHOB|nr:ribokinase [Gemmobacter aquatilis]SEM50461.1 ribokinase [Gemmobacter aquatilis]
MAIYNLGSINIDHVYRVPHLPAAGETLSALGYAQGLGGKGANQSVAAARAGACVYHIGAVGPGSDGVLAELAGYGVDLRHVAVGVEPTGHAIINVDPAAENSIVIYPGANRVLSGDMAGAALAGARAGDTLLVQNETSAQVEAAALAAARGMRVIYSAAPFEIAAVRAVLPQVSLLVMNEGEAAQLRAAEGTLPPLDCLITKGAQGAEWLSAGAEPLFMPAFKVTPVDTTGAGDTFIGTLAAALDLGLPREAAMRRAAAASALQVTRQGAAQAIPTAAEVDAFLQR